MGWIKSNTSNGGSLPYKHFKQDTAPAIFNPNGEVVESHSGTNKLSTGAYGSYNRIKLSHDLSLEGLSYKMGDTSSVQGNIRIYDGASGSLLASSTGTSITGVAGGWTKELLPTTFTLKANTDYDIGFWFNNTQANATYYSDSTLPSTGHSHTTAGGVSITHYGMRQQSADGGALTSLNNTLELSLRYHLAPTNTEPSSTEATGGDIWYDQINKVYKFCNSSSWVSM